MRHSVFRVYVLGFKFLGLGSRNKCLAFLFYGWWLAVYGSWIKVWGLGVCVDDCQGLWFRLQVECLGLRV